MTNPMDRPTILCAAFSARQIAMSARRASYGALAVDFFGDLDLQEAALAGEKLPCDDFGGFDDASLVAALHRLAEGHAPVGFVHGAGFEDRLGLLEEIGRHWPLLGTAPATSRLLKDPDAFADLCRMAGVTHPEIARQTPEGETHLWLSKRIGGCGGSHVRPAEAMAPSADRYVQKFVAGERWSAAFVAADAEAAILGFTKQWTDPSQAEPYRYGGAVGPLTPPEPAGSVMRDAIARIAAAVGARGHAPLTGLCSADFVVSADGPVLLEINARFGATIDVFDTDEEPLLALHLSACQGVLLARYSGPQRVRASGLAWAGGPVSVGAGFVWPDFTRDRTAAPAAFVVGQPMATIVAEADTEDAAVAAFNLHIAELETTFGRKAA